MSGASRGRGAGGAGRQVHRACYLTAVVVLLSGAGLAGADTGDDEAVEEIETVVVEPGADSQSGDSADSPQTLVGKLHPMAVHAPIGWLLLLLLVEAVGLRRPAVARAGLPLLLLTLAAFAPAIATGLLRAEDVARDAAIASDVADHRNAMLLAAATLVAACALRLSRRSHFGGAVRATYLLALALAAAAMTLGGHLGGKLVFGDQYLPF